MARINTDTHPLLILNTVNNVTDFLKLVTHIRTLARRIFNNGTHTSGLSQRYID